MAGKKYISQVAGVLTEVASLDVSAGAGDATKIPALNSSGVLDSTIVNSKTTSAGAGDTGKLPALDSTGRLDNSFMPVGIGAETASLTASEALSSGNFVNIYNNAGTPNCRKADATTAGKEANGFVLASVSSSATATVYLKGLNTGLSSLTAGPAFLSSTAGGVTGTAPSSSGNVVQRIGVIVNATTVDFTPSLPITLA